MVTTVGELVHPLGPTVCHTRAVEAVSRIIAVTGKGYVTITNLSDEPIGVITHQDIADLYDLPAETRASKRCASCMKNKPHLSVDDSLGAVVELFIHDEVWPLLVFDGRKAVGVLPPTEVFQWSAKHQPSRLNQLADRVNQTTPQTVPPHR